MPIRYFAILVFICFAIQHASAQRIPQFHALDSVKRVEKDTLISLAKAKAPSKIIAAITDKYDSIIDDLRDDARDAADSVIDHMDKCSHFELGFDFASRQLIYGRRGPAHAVEGIPSLKYMNWSGFYTMFNTDDYKLEYKQGKVLQKKPLKVDTVLVNKIENDIVLTLGFARTFYEWWDVDLYANHTFIFYGQYKNYLATTFNFNNSVNILDYLTIDIYYSLYFGGPAPPKEVKYSNAFTFGLSHDFKIYRFIGARVFTITPEFLTDVGNDNFVRNRLLARDANGGLSLTKPAVDNFFGLLNLEAGLNFDYRIKNLQIYVDPRVAIPFNVVPTTATSTAPYRNNDPDKPLPYITVGIKYLFKFWKEKHPNYEDGHKSKSR